MNINEVSKDKERQTIDILTIKELREFAKNVSVAGVEEALVGKTKIERNVWKICLVIVLTVMVVESVLIAMRYKFEDDIIMFSDLELPGGQPEFPNISICVPKMANKSKFQEIMVIPPDAWDLMKKTNVNIQQVVDFAGTVSVSDISAKGVNPGLVFVAEKVYDATYRSMPHSLSDLVQAMSSPCTDILSNCAIDGRPFDCCSAATFSYLEHAHCYVIETNTAKQLGPTQATDRTDQTELDVNILQVNVSTHWDTVQFLDGVSSAGYDVHIGQASPFSDPVFIPTNMDATIVLAPAHRMRQLTGCVVPGAAPSVAPYFDAYDPAGINCFASRVIEFGRKRMLCTGPILRYSPTNESICNARLFIGSSALLHGDLYSDMLDAKWMGESMDAKEKEVYDDWKSELDKDNCPPLCSRWSYRVLSTSYTSIVKKNDFNVDDKANVTWSRIKVLLPSSSYFVHEERLGNIIYVAVCEVGGCMGVFTGISVVTFFELIFYGPRACCAVARKRKNRVLTIHTARMVAPNECSGEKMPAKCSA